MPVNLPLRLNDEYRIKLIASQVDPNCYLSATATHFFPSISEFEILSRHMNIHW